MNLIQKYLGRDLGRLSRERILPNLKYLPNSQIRRCRACQKFSIHLQLGPTEEARLCLRCSANLRYEMLVEYLRESGYLHGRQILELDSGTPISALLRSEAGYVPTYFRPEHKRGSLRADGVRMEDITSLTFDDNSLDVIVSSDVLEHVPDAAGAFRETYRTLRPGGVHVFTVPNEPVTMERARLVDGEILHLTEPEYHSDPLDPRGILVFWHFGLDLQEHFGDSKLVFSIVKGPEGKDKRIVWEARKERRT